VSSRLAACVNIVPGLTSVYWWDGKVNRDSELLLVVKTRGALLGQLTDAVRIGGGGGRGAGRGREDARERSGAAGTAAWRQAWGGGRPGIQCGPVFEPPPQVKKLHPYDEPEVVALPIQGGSASYLKWLHDSTAEAAPNKLPDKLG
jgi:uncharacterized protein involved in tolerance to divalent cations